MRQAPNVLLLGGAGRVSGKTSFACRVIRRQSRRSEVYAVKVTPQSEAALHSPAALSPLLAGPGPDGFRILEDAVPSESTDTGRMLAAGARRAFWIVADPAHLDVAAAGLEALIPPGACVVAEGNSLRRVLEPGLFLLLKAREAGEGKASFREMEPLADRVVAFDGRDWDLSPDGCRSIDGAWLLRPPASAVVLAGGESRRMGRDKALLDVGGRPLIARLVDRLDELFDEIVIGAGRSGDYGFLGRPVLADLEPGQGPLMGIASCLESLGHDLALVAACDIPRPDLRFAASLLDLAEGVDLVMPRAKDGGFEPLFAVYRKSAAPAAKALLAAGERSILGLLDKLRVRIVPLPENVRLGNINTLDDFAEWAGTTRPDDPAD